MASERSGILLIPIAVCAALLQGCIDMDMTVVVQGDHAIGRFIVSAPPDMRRGIEEYFQQNPGFESREYTRGELYYHQELEKLPLFRTRPPETATEYVEVGAGTVKYVIRPIWQDEGAKAVQKAAALARGHHLTVRLRCAGREVKSALPVAVWHSRVAPRIEPPDAVWRVPLDLFVRSQRAVVFRATFGEEGEHVPGGEQACIHSFEHTRDLHLLYEPELRFHQDADHGREEYLPMDVSDFLFACKLYHDAPIDKPITLLDGFVTLHALGDISKKWDSSKWYLRLVDDHSLIMVPEILESAPSYNEDALREYLSVSDDVGACTYYVRRIMDRGYYVIQYWFFYAMNSHPIHYRVGNVYVGNLHEGDWECIMLFFDPLLAEPKFAAYCAHLRAGKEVVRPWDLVEKDHGTHPVVYVAVGSHAAYFGAGRTKTQVDDVVRKLISGSSWEGVKRAITYDYHNGQGAVIKPGRHRSGFRWAKRVVLEDTLNGVRLPDWARYFKGKWGNDAYGLEGFVAPFSGPRFPMHQNSLKWSDPVKWAGLPPLVH